MILAPGALEEGELLRSAGAGRPWPRSCARPASRSVAEGPTEESRVGAVRLYGEGWSCQRLAERYGGNATTASPLGRRACFSSRAARRGARQNAQLTWCGAGWAAC